MSDRYSNFEELSLNEIAGSRLPLIAPPGPNRIYDPDPPHGGGIEPGTSEVADAIAGEEFSFYAFEGLKSSDN